MLFDLPKIENEKALTIRLERTKIAFDLFTDSELIEACHNKNVLAFDIECYPNYFLVGFKCVETNKVVYFEQSPIHTIHYQKLLWIVSNFCIVGFNSNSYDALVLWLCLTGASCETLKLATNKIIVEKVRQYDIEKEFNFKVIGTNHIDLIEVAPLAATLKTYAGRLHAHRLQELPFNPDTYLTQEEAEVVLYYNVNDLDDTILLYKELKDQIDLRYQLSEQYAQDLRSKSDAQIAEAVIVNEVAKVLGYRPKPQKVAPGTIYKYVPPEYLAFKTPQLQNVLNIVKQADFIVSLKGKVLVPKEFKNLNIKIGSSSYTLQIGGLHSKESCSGHKSDERTLLLDRDVASFYPRIILNLGLYPENMGIVYLDCYGNIVEVRLGCKKTNKKKADSLKIVINGGFGKLGSKYSVFYSPNLLINVTMTGQLVLLMLIEMIESVGIPVVSGNTDGIIIKCPVERYEELNLIIAQWEKITNFETEETRYKGVYSRDVNNYFAFKDEGKPEARFLDDKLGVKVKGCFAERGSALNSVLSKNPEHLICSDAVMQLIVNNIPIEETILNCKDIKRFISVGSVKSKDGLHKDGVFLGKTARWYYAHNTTGAINRVADNSQLPKSEGAKPLQDLPASFPEDVNYKWYIDTTNEILFDIGYYEKKQSQLRFF
jgi:hypothetical protein